jgi:hypothetical protein
MQKASSHPVRSEVGAGLATHGRGRVEAPSRSGARTGKSQNPNPKLKRSFKFQILNASVMRRKDPTLSAEGRESHVSHRLAALAAEWTGLLHIVGIWFQVLFHSPSRGSFHLSLAVLVHYRLPRSI